MSNYSQNTAYTQEMREAKKAIENYFESLKKTITEEQAYKILTDTAWKYFLRVRGEQLVEENNNYETKPKRKNKYSSRVRT